MKNDLLTRFVVQLEWEKRFNKLTDEQLGMLFRLFFDYHNDKELHFEDDMVELVWLSLEDDIQRINHNYLTKIKNGMKGGRPKGTKNKPKVILKETETKPNTNQTKTDKEKDKDNENEKGNAASATKNIIEADWTWTDKDYERYWNEGYTIIYDGEIVEEGDLTLTF